MAKIDMMLVSDDGRPVRAWEDYMNRKMIFIVEKLPGEIEEIEQATIQKGKDVYFSKAHVAAALIKAGYGHEEVTISDGGYFYRARDYEYTTDSWGRSSRQSYKAPEPAFEKLTSELSKYNDLGENSLRGIDPQGNLDVQAILRIIGVGKVVTGESLMRGCAIDEDRPRFIRGDTVKFTIKKVEMTGKVTGLNSKVAILRSDGKKSNLAYSKVERTECAESWNDEIVEELDDSLAFGFAQFKKHAGQRVYRAKLTNKDVTFPVFPVEGEDERRMENVPSCDCPICGWPMAQRDTWESQGNFDCCFCKQKGLVLSNENEEVTLLLFRVPAKNKFALKEARCCNNCGLFQFEVGRQGKRSTGYCKVTNQCVQAHNYCEDSWMPRDPKRYSSNISQSIRNLKTGIKDYRNTNRTDIRDTIYKKEDHDEEVKRCERAKVVYNQAYEKLQEELREMATEHELHEGDVSQETTDAYTKALDEMAVD